jgi:hypothetical protein
MNGFFAASGVAFAAFCMWLAVRIANRQECWAKRTAVALACLVGLYVFSSGPVRLVACRLQIWHTTDSLDRVTGWCRTDEGFWWPTIYAPLKWVSDRPGGRLIERYWDLFRPLLASDLLGPVEREAAR